MAGCYSGESGWRQEWLMDGSRVVKCVGGRHIVLVSVGESGRGLAIWCTDCECEES